MTSLSVQHRSRPPVQPATPKDVHYKVHQVHQLWRSSLQVWKGLPGFYICTFMHPYRWNFILIITIFQAQVVVGGYNSGNYLVGGSLAELSSAEIFPRPASSFCAIPDLPEPRTWHTMSLLSGGRLVVCGGDHPGGGDYDSCISWVSGNRSWTHLFTMRCIIILTYKIDINTRQAVLRWSLTQPNFIKLSMKKS